MVEFDIWMFFPIGFDGFWEILRSKVFHVVDPIRRRVRETRAAG